MRLALLTLLITFSPMLHSETNFEKVRSLQTVKRIAFGSCNNQSDKQPLWKDIQAQKPDLWIWGGDIIYADWDKSKSIEESYKKQLAQPDYAAFKAQTPMIGIWDDHDYAGDEATGRFSMKKLSQKLFLDFFEEPEDSPRRQQEGIYTSFEFGEQEQRIKIILLDNRYYKGLEKEAPLLGAKQWEWLENEFKNSKAQLHIIVAGLSVFSPILPYTEEWRHHPGEVSRMLKLLKLYNVKAPVFLTGDKHFSSIFKDSNQLEFMSSGLTHTAPPRTWWYLARKFPATYFGLSYGVIDVEWENSIPRLTMFMRNGERTIHKTIVQWNQNTWDILHKSDEPSMQWDFASPSER